MRIFALLTVLVSAQDKISCYQCDYSWVVAKVDGKEVTTPVRGDSKCRDGSAENGDFGDPIVLPREQDLGNGNSARYKCATVRAKGTETIYYNGDKTYDVEFDVFDRKPIMVFDNSDLYDYVGEVHLTEDSYICGANRTECNVNLALKESKVETMAACPRCTASLSNGTWAIGDVTCMTASLDGYPDANNKTCMFDPEPSITPTMRSASTFQQLGVGIDGLEDQSGSEMSGECIIWEENYSLPSKPNVEQQYNLYRMCNSYAVLPFNFYSEMVMTSNNMTVCDEDLCNGPANGPGNGISSVNQSVAAIISLLFIMFE